MENKVLLALIDGLRPDAVPLCGEPKFEALLRSGTHTFNGRTVFPSVTLPCHVSLFYGVRPARHRVYSNTFVKPFPPLKGLIERLAAEKKTSGFFHTWEQLRDLNIPNDNLTCSWYLNYKALPPADSEWRVTKAAKDCIREYAPDFAFLYLGNTDVAGHAFGWMSPEYLDAVKTAASCVLDVYASLTENYSLIITADHGGHGHGHGSRLREDMTIPIAFIGRPFAAGKEIPCCSILDIAPTVTEVMGVKPGAGWKGKSVLGPDFSDREQRTGRRALRREKPKHISRHGE